MRIATCIAVLPLLAGCGMKPTSHQVEQAVERQLQAQLPGTPFRLKEFSVTNGQDMEVFGVKVYEASYTAQIEFPRGHRPECVQRGRRFNGFNCVFGFATTRTRIPPQPIGSTISYTGRVTFQKSDRGWVTS